MSTRKDLTVGIQSVTDVHILSRRRLLVRGGLAAAVLLAFAAVAGAQPCVVPDNGGTVDLPPAGCEYLTADQVHEIVNGLPLGTTIELAAIHKDFICNREPGTSGVCSFIPDPLVDCDEAGGSLGGEKECSDSTLNLQLTGTGSLAGWTKAITLPISFEVHTGPRIPGSPVQDFPAEMFRLYGQLLPGDPDFDLLRIVAGTDFGLPSPGHTTLTQLPGGNWAVDSFFDITYRIDFVGSSGGHLAGLSGSTTATIRMKTGDPACGPLPDGSGCFPAMCPSADETCRPRCVNFNPTTGAVSVTDCACVKPDHCHIEWGARDGGDNGPRSGPCEVLDNGSGTVTLPPIGCEYLSPSQVHEIIAGLPPGTTIQLAPIHQDFICRQSGEGICSLPIPPGMCETTGGLLGGNADCFDSNLNMVLTGTGLLAGWTKSLSIPAGCEVHTGPRIPGDPVQTFPNEMFRLMGQVIGDPDFDLLRITSGIDYGLPSPGQTTLTQLPDGTWKVDSFFDITYRIDFIGAPGGPLAGLSGSTTATIHMVALGGAPATPPHCVGGCPPGYTCHETITQLADGTLDYCCDCQRICPCPGDLDGSGRVDMLDVPFFVDALLNGTYKPCADINLDGAVNGLDIQPFVDLVLSGGLCLGACCFPDGHCEIKTMSDCNASGGTYKGDGTLCTADQCQPQTGACCDQFGGCTQTTQTGCNGTWMGLGILCMPNPCLPQTGACCQLDGTCTVTTQASCTGTWIAGITCTPNPCPQPTGACCDQLGGCTQTTQAGCNGTWMGPGIPCAPNPCPPPQTGACCDQLGGCTQTTQAGCIGTWKGLGVSCTPNPCPPTYCVTPGFDCWNTGVSCTGTTKFSFLPCPIPASFFDPGSQPFTGMVNLRSNGTPPYYDTKMERLGTMCFPLDQLPATDSTPVRLSGLELKGCSAILVIGSGQWNVYVTLVGAGDQPPGQLTATMTSPQGGTFSATFFVQPVLMFQRVASPYDWRTLSASACPPIMLGTAAGGVWSTIEYPDSCSTLGDGWQSGRLPSGGCPSQETCHENPGASPDHQHCVRSPGCQG